MSDLIKRKGIVDTVCEGISCNECSFNEIDGESGCLLEYRIDQLPSAKPEPLTLETYTLVLYHNILFGGEELKVEDPIAIKYTVQLSEGSSSYMLNEMMDRMKHEVLSRFGR